VCARGQTSKPDQTLRSSRRHVCERSRSPLGCVGGNSLIRGRLTSASSGLLKRRSFVASVAHRADRGPDLTKLRSSSKSSNARASALSLSFGAVGYVLARALETLGICGARCGIDFTPPSPFVAS